MRVLLTAANGKIGSSIQAHWPSTQKSELVLGVRNPSQTNKSLFEERKLDFNEVSTFTSALSGIQTLFLLRPPQISDVKNKIFPLLKIAQKEQIHVVLLSVQGAERSKVIPHRKIELEIERLGRRYTFLRPSYFMENLTQEHGQELRLFNLLKLPAPDALFNWISTKDVGAFAAKVLQNPGQHQNNTYTLTGCENKSFSTVINQLNTKYSKHIQLKKVWPLTYFFNQYRLQPDMGYAFVKTALHTLPAYQRAPIISEDFEKLLKRKPITLDSFFEEDSELKRLLSVLA